jgi:3-oxoadipate enol-lactonase
MMKNIKLKDLQLYYQDQGTGYTVVLVHGLASDHTVWEGISPLLAQNYHVLALDLRGHGISSKTPGPYNMELFAQDIYNLLKALDIDQAHFMGHSMGGAVLMQLASQKPNIARSLTLISSFAHPNHHIQEMLRRLLKILREEGFSVFFDACLHLANTPQFIQKNAALFSKIRDEMAKNSSTSSLEDTINACLEINLLNSIKRIKNPTLVIAGKEDLFVPADNGIEIKNNIPHAKIHLMERACHNLLVEQPHQTFQVLDNFLDQM